MATARRSRFVRAVLAWLLASTLVLTLLDAFDLELLLLIGLIGLLIVTELTAPFNVTPKWRRRVKWLVGLGAVVLAYLSARQMLTVLPGG